MKFQPWQLLSKYEPYVDRESTRLSVAHAHTNTTYTHTVIFSSTSAFLRWAIIWHLVAYIHTFNWLFQILFFGIWLSGMLLLSFYSVLILYFHTICACLLKLHNHAKLYYTPNFISSNLRKRILLKINKSVALKHFLC